MVLYAPTGTNTIDFRPIFIHDATIQWEISPRYLAYCLNQMYDYDEKIHVWIKTTVEGEKKKPKEKEVKTSGGPRTFGRGHLA